MSIRIKTIDLERFNRVIVVSDLHGDLDGFQATLNKLNFTNTDALIIVGDMLEKGNQSLALLNQIMKYVENGNVFATLGNNDVFFEEWFNGIVQDEDILYYMNSRDTSVLIDMANECSLEYKSLSDIEALKEMIAIKFKNELSFLNELPHIIDTEFATFVHAGLMPCTLQQQDVDYCLTAKEFGKQEHKFDKLVVVGHWPTSNYCDEIISIMPYYNQNTNVISIDGGNSMKSWRQINYLIFKNNEISEIGYYDSLPKVRILENQKASTNPLTVIFPQTKVDILNKFDDKVECYLPSIEKKITINENSIYVYKRENYCSDFTTYEMDLSKDEIVSYCKQVDGGILVKRNGIVGKYTGKYTFID